MKKFLIILFIISSANSIQVKDTDTMNRTNLNHLEDGSKNTTNNEQFMKSLNSESDKSVKKL